MPRGGEATTKKRSGQIISNATRTDTPRYAPAACEKRSRKNTHTHTHTHTRRSNDPLPCRLGVRQIWAHSSARGKGVATELLDRARVKAVYGVEVGRGEVAFSSPTEAGAALAKSWTGGRPKVYDC